MEGKALGKFADDSELQTGTFKRDNIKKKRTEFLKRSIAFKHFLASRKNLLQSSHSNQDFDPFHEEKSECNRDDVENKRRAKNSQDIPQQCDTQIPNVTVGTTSIGASETYQNKNQEYNFSRKESLDDYIMHLRKRIKKDINVTSINHISTERSDSKAAPNSSLKNKLSRKHTQDFVHKSTDKNFCSESNTVFPKDKSSIFAEEMNISISPLSQNKLSDTAMPIRLTKRYSRRSIDSSEDDYIFVEQKEKEKSKTKQELSSANLKTESRNPQTDSQIEINSKTIKRKISSGNLDQSILPIKIRKKNKINTSPDKMVDSNIEVSDYEILSNDKVVHTKQENSESIAKCIIKKRENYKFLMRKKKRHRKGKKIKHIRGKLLKYFRGSFDPDTSENEEEREILLNHRKRSKLQSDNLLSDITTEEEVEDIFKRDKKLIYDEKCCIYDATTDERTDDEASICKRGSSIDNSQEVMKNTNSDNLCDSTICTEKHSMHNVATDEKIEDEALIYDYDTVDNSQESITPVESKNPNNSSERTKKYYAINDTTEKNEEPRDEALICTSDASNNSQKNIESAIESSIPIEIKSNNLCVFIASTKTHVHNIMYNAITDKKIKNKASICSTSAKSQKNIKCTISDEMKSDNSDFIANTEECYVIHDVMTEKKITDEVSPVTSNVSTNNSKKNVESAISVRVKSDNSHNSTASSEKYHAMHDVTSNEEVEDEISLCETLPNNLQDTIKSAISDNIRSDNSSDSTAYVEKNCAMHDATRDKEIEDRASVIAYKRGTMSNNLQENTTRGKEIEDRASVITYKCGTISNDLQENIKNKVPTKKQYVQNSSSIVDKENKNDARAESNKDITPSTSIEIDLDENMIEENIHLNQNIKKKANIIYTKEKVDIQVALANRQEDQEVCNVESTDLAQCKNIKNHVTLNLESPITSAHESTSYEIGEKDKTDCDVLQNAENLLMSNDNNAKNDKKIDQLSVTTSISEGNSLERKHDESLSIQTTKSFTSSTNSNYCDDVHSLDSHSTDDDNNSDIEIEIKIKPKVKSRISRKFSLKAPWCAVNTCIKSLHTLKDNSNFLNKLFQTDDKTSEKSKHKSINRNPENSTSLDDNENVTVETEDCDIICDSSHTVKDNVNDSQQQNFQDYSSSKNKNTLTHNKKKRNECTQSINAITENCSESSELVCDTSDLRGQKAPTEAKQKINEEQNFRDNTTLEEAKSVAGHTQGKENERVSSLEQKKTQLATENSPKSITVAYDTPNVIKQLLQMTSSDETYSKVRIRSIAELNYQCTVKSTSLNVSAPSKSVCSALCQSVPFQSVPPQSIPQSTPPQSVPPQSIPPQSIPPQSTPQSISQSTPQSTPPQSIPPQSTPQSIPPQSTPQSIPPQSTYFQSAPPLLVSPQFISPQPTCSQPTHSQLIRPQSHQSNSQATRPLLVPSQLTLPQSIRPQLVSPQLTPQSATKRLPSYDTAVRHMYPKANAPVAPIEINTRNINNNLTNIELSIKRICVNIEYCRGLIRCKLLRMHISAEHIQRMCIILREINQDLQTLKIWLRTNDVECAMTYINQYMLLHQPITLMEFNNYIHLIQSFKLYATQNLEQNNANSNASQHSNIGISVPNASSVNAQSFSRSAPFPDIARSNYGKSTQSSAPCPATTIPNQQQLFNNMANPSQIYSRQPTSNIRQQYMRYGSSAAHSRMPNANQQQSLRNASRPVQNQYMPSTSVPSNVGVQQVSVNNISSNTNIHSYGPVNQRNANVPPATNTRQSHIPLKNTISATTSTANAQQQKQMYFQTSQINSGTTNCPPPMTNQNIPSGIRQTMQNATLSGFFAANRDAPRNDAVMGNVRHGAANMNQQHASYNQQVYQVSSERHGAVNMNQQHASYNQQVYQVSSERAEYNCCQNSNKLSYNFVSQSAYCNMQTHSVQNIQPDQNVRKTLQQKLQQHQIRPKNTSVCLIDLTTNDISQNMQQNVLNKKTKLLESQSRDLMQKKTSSTNPQQDLHQETSSSTNRPQQDLRQETSSFTNPQQERQEISSSTNRPQQDLHQETSSSTNRPQQDLRQKISSSTNPQQERQETSSSTNRPQQDLRQETSSSSNPQQDRQETSSFTNPQPDLRQETSSSTNLQRDLRQETSSAYNVSQNRSGTLKTSTSQRAIVLQNTKISKISIQKNNKIVLILPESTLVESHQEKQSQKKNKKVLVYHFNPTVLTDIQKVILRDQIQSYFFMLDQLKHSLSAQEFERTHYERTVLYGFFWNLNDHIESLIRQSQTIDCEKCTGKDSQDNTSQDRSVLQKNTMQTSVDSKSTKAQSRSNENSSVYNRNLESQSLVENSNSIISKSSEPMAVKNHLEARNEELSLSSLIESAIIKELHKKDTKLQEQNNNTLETECQKNVLIDTEKRSESAEASSPGHLRTPEENSIKEVSAKDSESETQNNVKINEFTKGMSSCAKQFPTLYSLLDSKSSLNSSQAALAEKMNQPEMTKSDANEKSNNVEMESTHKTSNVVTLNNSERKDATSRASYNTEDQNKEVCNLSDEIPSENLQDGTRDDVNKNIEILNSTEIQSDPLNTISRDSIPTSSNNIAISPIKKCESTEMSQIHAETISECLNAQQEDSMHEQGDSSTEGTSESSGKLYIDESVLEGSQNQECDKISSSEEDNLNTSQDHSAKPFDAIKCDSTEVMPLSLLTNTAEVADTSQDFLIKAQDAEIHNKKLLEAKKTLVQEVSLKFENEWNMRESTIRPSDTIKEPEDTKEENSEQSLLKIEEIQLEDILKFEDKWNMGEDTIQPIDIIKEPEDTKEEDSEKSLLKVEELQLEDILDGWNVEEDTMQPIDNIKKPEDTTKEDSEQSLLEAQKMQLEEMSLKFEDDWNMEEDTIQSIDTVKEPEDTKEDNKRSPLKVQKMQLEEMSLKFLEDASNTEESAMHLKINEDMEEEKMEIDTHSGVKTINEQLKHISEQKYYGKSQTSSCNSVEKDDPINVEAKSDIECISVKSDDSEVMTFPSILSITSISPSLFEKMENTDIFLQSDSQSSQNEKDEKSLNINDNLGIPIEVDDKPCLRCKRKSMVYCQACLEAHYCSKRCSSLHWNTEHYKQCKGRNSIICIDV